MPHVARLFRFVLALLWLAAVASVDLRPQSKSWTASAAAAVSIGLGELEDGPEGEEAPTATTVRAFGDDDSAFVVASVAVDHPIHYVDVSCECSRPAPESTHSPCAGPPTGPPQI